MQISIADLNPDYLVYGGATGILLGFVFFSPFFYRQIRWLLLTLTRRKPTSSGLFSSIRDLVLVMVRTSLLGMLLFFGFFLRAHAAFDYEKPGTEVIVQASMVSETSRITLAHLFSIWLQRFFVSLQCIGYLSWRW